MNKIRQIRINVNGKILVHGNAEHAENDGRDRSGSANGILQTAGDRLDDELTDLCHSDDNIKDLNYLNITLTTGYL